MKSPFPLRSPLPLTALALALALCSTDALAWGAQGHRLVGRVAESRLTPTARAEVDRLLASEADPTLAGVAPWADQLRATDRDLGKRSAGWHYVNIAEDNCVYQAAKHCPDGNCVVEALKDQTRILSDRRNSDAERAQALKFVVHLVGDIHQPMHAGFGHDKGGNEVQVQFNGRGSNLHSVWDSGLLNTRGLDDAGYLTVLQALPQPALARRVDVRKDAEAWAESSCRIAVEKGVYPTSRKLGADYTDRYRPVAESELRIAGEHLAQVLNRTLGPR
ncbi:S1/P1 nuclease [Stenotrophomonas sp. CFBP 13725]|uniref:S1/P1 nuclease n=1 Tax=Stenotrophomonas sp. CFBP 13725 TaxID=2775297 RepID=UPI001781EC99|nr:S1/P1 nuclease [Stenotrophomonas sp. CFBP 13725]MBD8636499.1 S1/P1 nuclease [Stenotrophomonas sp. CFBP 13725]